MEGVVEMEASQHQKPHAQRLRLIAALKHALMKANCWHAKEDAQK
jgi:hypothetical protein